MEAVFATIEKTWVRLDFLLHSIAWAPSEDLHGRLTDSSGAGFAQSMLVSCHSFIRMAKLAEPLMIKGGTKGARYLEVRLLLENNELSNEENIA